MRKKAQAAMEFLMTYGWAILVVLVVIGALAYFGVLNPDALVPDKCTLVTGISCNDFIVQDDHIQLFIGNGLGKGIMITSIKLATTQGDQRVICESNNGFSMVQNSWGTSADYDASDSVFVDLNSNTVWNFPRWSDLNDDGQLNNDADGLQEENEEPCFESDVDADSWTDASGDCQDIDFILFLGGEEGSFKPITIENGGSEDFSTETCGFASDLSQAVSLSEISRKPKFDLEVTYYFADSTDTYSHTATGELLAKVQE